MRVFRTLDSVKIMEDTVVAVGNFDGVHRGHQELIRRAVKTAKAANMKSAVFTFANHPKNVMNPEAQIKNILRFEDKARILKKLGVVYLVSVDFTKEIAKTPPQEFITKILLERLHMREVCCGFNYAFGSKGKGTPELLAHMSVEQGFGLHILEPVKVGERVVSSTLIRECIASGDMENCRRYLGRFYEIGGEVILGNQIGRTIGFPTSNMVLDDTMVTPSHGVYVTLCAFDGCEYQSITNVGTRPTIGDERKTIETHIFDFTQDIYGKEIRVTFLKKLRDEMRFENVQALSAQIKKDCEDARICHDNFSGF